MPVRSLSSFVLRWPDREEVDRSVRTWAGAQVRSHAGVRRIGYFGSYARGDWGVGSDIDLLILVDTTAERFERRSLAYDASSLPVPADILVYTSAEWGSLASADHGPGRGPDPIVWVFPTPDAP